MVLAAADRPPAVLRASVEIDSGLVLAWLKLGLGLVGFGLRLVGLVWAWFGCGLGLVCAWLVLLTLSLGLVGLGLVNGNMQK